MESPVVKVFDNQSGTIGTVVQYRKSDNSPICKFWVSDSGYQQTKINPIPREEWEKLIIAYKAISKKFARPSGGGEFLTSSPQGLTADEIETLISFAQECFSWQEELNA